MGKEESCLAEYKGAEEGMGVCTAASSVPNIQDQLNKVLPEFEHTFVFVNNMTKEHLSFRTYIYIFYCIGVAPLYWL